MVVSNDDTAKLAERIYTRTWVRIPFGHSTRDTHQLTPVAHKQSHVSQWPEVELIRLVMLLLIISEINQILRMQ
jgi:hypothetical protein